MPYIRIETCGDWLKPHAAALFAGIDAALTRVLKVPPRDSLIRMHCHEPDLISLPRGAEPDFVLLEVALFPGRSPDTKAALYRELTAALAALGVAPSRVTIALLEIGLHDWGIGGRPAHEVYPLFPSSLQASAPP